MQVSNTSSSLVWLFVETSIGTKAGQATDANRGTHTCEAAHTAHPKTRNSNNVRGRQTMTGLTGNLGRGVKRASTRLSLGVAGVDVRDED